MKYLPGLLTGLKNIMLKPIPDCPGFQDIQRSSELLGIHSHEIKSFLKKEKINVKKEADLIKVLNYFDSLN